MPAPRPPAAASYAAFHRAAYPASILDARDALGLTLLRTGQPAGRFRNAATPDLMIGRAVSGGGLGLANLGAGRFRNTGRIGETMVAGPGAASAFDIDAPHAVLIPGLPHERLRGLEPELGLPRDGDFGALHRGSFEDAPLAGIVDGLWAESAASTALGRLFLEGALLALAARLMRRAGREPGPAPGGLAPWRLRRALELLDATPGEALPLAALAAEVGLSTWHFARAFCAATGLPPHRFQTRRRIARAEALLAGTDRGVTEIALEVGYLSGQAFARAFLRETGTTPSAFRAAHRG
jgi:AraC family transcriptional regulator